MKHLLLFIFAVLCLTMNTSCDDKEEQVVARFLIIGNNSYAPASIEFKEDNTNAQEFEWIFPNGLVIKDRFFTKTFNEAGTFPVKLIVRGLGGQVDSITQDVVVKEAPTRLYIKSVQLKETPMSSSSGSAWDASGGPDIFLRFQGISFDTEVKSDVVSANFPLTWTFSEPYPYFSFSSINKEFFIYVYDQDNTPQLMANTGFKVSDFTYDSTIEYDNRFGTALKLSVEWGN